jgi:predicted glycosyltransferase
LSARRRVLVYGQHLSGVGHHVRIREIARALARDHRVAFVQGGPPVPRPDDGGELEPVELPRIRRGRSGLEPLDPGQDLAAVLCERAARLRRAASELAPDVLIVEHYPFSKWELEPEITAMIAAARAANPKLEVICSTRDVVRRTRHETGGGEEYRRRVVCCLNRDFDRLFVHGDPGFTRLEEHFDGAGELAIPLHYTGFVSEKAQPVDDADGSGWVVVSSGGGAGSAGLIAAVIDAWQRLVARGAHGGRRLRVFTGLFLGEHEVEALRRRAAGTSSVVAPFGPDFLRWLARADLSISRAGYNTCTNLLETRTRALLLPDPRMSDQHYRARRFAELGLAESIAGGTPAPDELAAAIGRALGRARPRHAFDLEGALRTRELLSR